MVVNYNVDSAHIGKVFDGKTAYVVPDYQRRYDWTKRQVEELLDDLLDEYSGNGPWSGDEYMLGPIVLFYNKDEEIFNIIDGQQRLITLTLLFRAFQTHLEKRLDGSEEAIQTSLQSLIRNINNLIRQEHLKLNRFEDNEILKHIIKLGELPKPKQRSKIEKNYSILLNYVEKLCENYGVSKSDMSMDGIEKIRDLISDLKERVSFVRVVINNEKYSHQIFQSLNAKGQKLRQADLIKSYILKKCISPTKYEEVKTKWEKIMDDKNISPDTLIYESMQSRNLSSKKIKKNDLYNEVKSRAEPSDRKPDEQKLEEWVVDFVDELCEDEVIINKLHNPKNLTDEEKSNPSLKHGVYGLKQINATYLRIPIITAWREWKGDDRNIVELIDCTAKFFFMYRTICKKDIDKLKKNAAEMTRQIMNKCDMDHVLYTLLKYTNRNGEHEHVRADEFETGIKNTEEWDADEAKYVLFSIEHDLWGKDVQIDDSNLEIEHIFPQKPNDSDWKEKNMSDHVDRLGNLTLMDKDWNKELQNFRFKTKREHMHGYLNSQLKINQLYLAKYDKWSVAEINEREEKIMKHAVKVLNISEYLVRAKKS